jgi:2-keto-4-pentenoate hydratase/2-oxohepta-3-ene-1,7-dioic acid hydratase in catechol pathway
MFFKIDDIISLISQQIRLEPGDLILTGSPEGA